MEQENSKNIEESMVFQLARFISFYDVYSNLCQSRSKDKYLIDYKFSKENTLILLFSNLYSLFDSQNNAQSLDKIVFENEEVEKLRTEIIDYWDIIKDEIKKIRHNIGFHTSKTLKGQQNGVNQFGSLGKEPFELINKIIFLYFKYVETTHNLGLK